MVERYHTLVGHRADHGHTNTGIYYRRRRARRYAFTLATLLTLGSAGWADAFSNHPLAKTNYTHTPLTPVLGCADLLASSNFRYTIIASEKIAATAQTPAHCRVSGIIPLEVRFEVNLPLAWNGRLYMYGNGGMAGTPAHDPGKQLARNQALQHGFGTAYTDTGHDRRIQPGGSFAAGNIHRLVDYGFRAVHLTIMTAKTLATEFYGQPAQYSYFNGCSTGGRQALLSAQRFPQDFDGVIAGAPAANYSGLKFSQAWRVAAISQSGLEEAEVVALSKHIYARCDALDGLSDGLISDPRRCDFDPSRDLPRCPGDDEVECFDAQELNALKRYYAPVVLAGETVYPPMPVGSEAIGTTYDRQQRSGWYPWLINPDGPVLLDLLGSDFFRYMAFVRDRPDFDWADYDFVEAPDNLAEFRRIVDAVNPDLSAFKQAGGKVLSYFGWADPDINPLTLINYHAQVKRIDEHIDDYFRVFMLPGVFHCRGGPGPDRFDAMSLLIDWVEHNHAPQTMLTWQSAPSGERVQLRPACVFPAEAQPNTEDTLECRVPDDLN